MKDSFVLFTEQKEIINKLSDEQAGKLFKALFDYVSDIETPNEIQEDLATDIVFTTLKQTIDRNNEKWEEIKQKRSEAGKKHKGNQYTTNGTNKNKMEQMEQNGTNGTNNVSVNVNDNVSVSVVEEEKEEATTPMVFYLNNINSTPVAKEVEIIESYEKDLPADLLIYGMEKAVENKARNLAYCKGIWNSWIKKGITTIAEAKDEKRPPPKVESLQKYRSDQKVDNFDKYYANL